MLYYRFLPIAMVLWNVLYLIIGLLAEGRVKPNAARFAVMYSMTVVPAMRGDMDPFLVVFMQPPT